MLPTVATAGVLLVQVPPVVVLVSVVVAPIHMPAEPEIEAGVVFVATLIVLKQPALVV